MYSTLSIDGREKTFLMTSSCSWGNVKGGRRCCCNGTSHEPKVGEEIHCAPHLCSLEDKEDLVVVGSIIHRVESALEDLHCVQWNVVRSETRVAARMSETKSQDARVL